MTGCCGQNSKRMGTKTFAGRIVREGTLEDLWCVLTVDVVVVAAVIVVKYAIVDSLEMVFLMLFLSLFSMLKAG